MYQHGRRSLKLPPNNNSIYQQKAWSIYDFHQLQRCSARFYYVNFRVIKRHAGPFKNPRESVAVIEVSKHGTRTLVQPRRMFFTDLIAHMDGESRTRGLKK